MAFSRRISRKLTVACKIFRANLFSISNICAVFASGMLGRCFECKQQRNFGLQVARVGEPCVTRRPRGYATGVPPLHARPAGPRSRTHAPSPPCFSAPPRWTVICPAWVVWFSLAHNPTVRHCTPELAVPGDDRDLSPPAPHTRRGQSFLWRLPSNRWFCGLSGHTPPLLDRSL